MAHRNAASVLPDPVGAMTSVLSPSAMAAHACGLGGGRRGEGAGEPLPRQRAEPGERVDWLELTLAIVPTATDKSSCTA